MTWSRRRFDLVTALPVSWVHISALQVASAPTQQGRGGETGGVAGGERLQRRRGGRHGGAREGGGEQRGMCCRCSEEGGGGRGGHPPMWTNKCEPAGPSESVRGCPSACGGDGGGGGEGEGRGWGGRAAGWTLGRGTTRLRRTRSCCGWSRSALSLSRFALARELFVGLWSRFRSCCGWSRRCPRA